VSYLREKGEYFHTSVTINRMIEPGQNVWIVWDNPPVVCREIAYFVTAAIVRSSVNGIAVAGHEHFFLERF
jgi:hypothetical protein